MSANVKLRSPGLEVKILTQSGHNPILNPILTGLCHFCVKVRFS